MYDSTVTSPPISFLANLSLLFSKESVMAPLLLFRILFLNRKIFTHVAILLFFMMIFNTYLKSIWQIPLDASIGPGWAFPSGHMSASIVYWGYLALVYPYWVIRIAITLLLITIGWALTYQGYHNIEDICGSLLFGLPTLVAYYLACQKLNHKDQSKFFLGLICLGLSFIILLPSIPNQVWFGFSGLCIFIIISRFSNPFYQVKKTF